MIIRDEGTLVGRARELNFTGSGVSASVSGGVAAINATGGGTVLWAPPQGLRLSLTTNVYVTTANVTAAGTLYWTPVVSGGTGVVTGYNGSSLATKTVQQKSLSLTVTSGKNYDVFYDYDGDVLALSSAWTNDTTPADALADEQGAIVLGSDHTKLWIGTIRASGTNTCEMSALKGFVWNAYNQAPTRFLVIDTTDFWTYNSASFHQANANSANKFEYVTGIAAQLIEATAVGVADVQASEGASVGIGIDSTSSNSADIVDFIFSSGVTGTPTIPVRASYRSYPGLGYHQVVWLERSSSTAVVDFYGDNNSGGLIQTGLFGQGMF